jgi:hypothetical protein
MKRHLVLPVALSAFALASCSPAAAQSWIFQRSTYSHDPATGERLIQYRHEKRSYLRDDDTYLESGYRQIHVGLLGADGSYDHTHVVQTWGLGELIRPYGEWQFPYRAGATPFGPWGNPSGPWTLPFDSWQNPYGLGKLPNQPYGPYYSPNGGGYGPGVGGPAGAVPYPAQPGGAPYPGPQGGAPYQVAPGGQYPMPNGQVPPPPMPHNGAQY